MTVAINGNVIAGVESVNLDQVKQGLDFDRMYSHSNRRKR